MWVCGTSDQRTGLANTWASSFIFVSIPPQTHGEMNFQFLVTLFSVAEQLVVERDQTNWSVHGSLSREGDRFLECLKFLQIYIGFNCSHCNLVLLFFLFHCKTILFLSMIKSIYVRTSYLSCYTDHEAIYVLYFSFNKVRMWMAGVWLGSMVSWTR